MALHTLGALIVVCCSMVAMVTSRGRLVDPPNRSSIWREAPGFPVNKNDSDLNCRGDLIPYIPDMENWCGTCGDPTVSYPHHELGGKYVRRFTVTRTYRTTHIPVKVLVETFKGGYFEFSLCPHNFAKRRVSPECFRENRMNVRGMGLRYYPYTTGLHKLMLTVPEEFTCRHCILQWRWVTEEKLPPAMCMNSFIPPRVCLAKNEIRNCADIAIKAPKRRREREMPELEDILLWQMLANLVSTSPGLGSLLMMDA